MKYTFIYLFLLGALISHAQEGYFDGLEKKELKSAYSKAVKNAKVLQQQANWQPQWIAIKKTFEADVIQTINKDFTLVGTLKLDSKTGVTSPEFWQLLDLNGKTIWSIPRAKHKIINTDGAIILATDKEMLALNMDTGDTQWSYPIDTEAILVQNASVYLIGTENLKVLDGLTGEVRNTIALSGLGFNNNSNPQIYTANNHLLLQQGNQFVKVDLTTQAAAWKQQLPSANASFLIQEQTLFSYDKHNVSSYTLANGKENWTIQFEKDTIATIIVKPSAITVWATQSIDSWHKDILYSLHPETGVKQWEYHPDYSINSSIKEVGNHLLFTEKNSLICLNKQTGQEAFQLPFSKQFSYYGLKFDRLYAKDNVLYIYRPIGGVQAVDITNKKLLWQVPLFDSYPYLYSNNSSLLELNKQLVGNSNQISITNGLIQSPADAQILAYDRFLIDQYLKESFRTSVFRNDAVLLQSSIYLDIYQQQVQQQNNATFNKYNAGFGLTGMNGAKPKPIDPLKLAASKRLSLLYEVAEKDYLFPFKGDYFIHPIQKGKEQLDTGFKIIELSTGKTKDLWTAPGVSIDQSNMRNLFYLDIPAFEFQATSNQLIFADLGLKVANYEPLSFGKTQVPMSSIMGVDVKELMATASPANASSNNNQQILEIMSTPMLLLQEGRYEQLKAYIEKHPIDLDNTSTGKTLLYTLIAQRSPNAKTTKIDNPHTDYFIDFLIAKGADVNMGIDSKTKSNINIPEETPFFFTEELLRYSSPLLLAVAIGDLPLAAKLVKNGANIEQPNYHGENLGMLIKQKKLAKGNSHLQEVEALYRL